MNKRPIILLVLMGCLLMAVPAMATTVGAQTADDGTTNATNTTTDTAFAFDSTLDNGTVTVSVTSNDTAVENASVAVNGTEAGTTDENGTLQFGLDNRSAVEIGVTIDNTTQSTTSEVVDDSLVEVTETSDETTDFAFDATLADGTVTVSTDSNDTAVANASVAVNGSDVGTTDANGTLQFPLENRPAVEIAVTVDETTRTTTYEVVGGELITQESAEDAQEVPEEAADQVSTIQQLISAFRNGEFEKLGPIVSEAAGRGPPADVGNGSDTAPENAGNGQGNAPDNASNGNAPGNPGNAPENAGNGNAPENPGNAPENAGNGQGNEPDQAGNGSGNAPEDAGNGQDGAGNGQNDNGANGGSDRGGSGGQGNGGSSSGGGQGNGGQGNGQGAGGR